MFDSAGGASIEKLMAGRGTVRDTENPTERAANEIASHNPRPRVPTTMRGATLWRTRRSPNLRVW